MVAFDINDNKIRALCITVGIQVIYFKETPGTKVTNWLQSHPLVTCVAIAIRIYVYGILGVKRNTVNVHKYTHTIVLSLFSFSLIRTCPRPC